MSLTFKLLSLAIRTAAKPIGNYIKRQAKEHDGFRRFAVTQAQRVHRIDMRMRLGILHDAEAQQRMHEREQRAADEKKRKAEAPTARTEAEQKKFDEDQAKAEAEGRKQEKKEPAPKVKIRPLSEAKAIELGANFFSEAFIFAVAAGLIVWDTWRSRRKESQRRDDVADRLDALEMEVQRLRLRYEPLAVEGVKRRGEREREYAWYNPVGWWRRSEPVEAEGEVSVRDITGSVPVGQEPVEAVKVDETKTGDGKDAKAQMGEQNTVTAALPAKDEPTSQRIVSVAAGTKAR
ncbi:Optic atrophy 3 protein (OPA3) [Teratosphaeria destructans]|uniref:Optic atrophy 3 protein (OPA3) n=1 Tax=Teratosphaeria destructans TaxID=418781 RepID=A0A9W7SJB8_9PEZI|nr:Optic atrophy 3 protein (OPA3) [Teratosphaeria destructans]